MMSRKTSDPIPFLTLAGDISIAPRSTPTPLLFKDKLYIFYNGCSDDGVWYTTTDASGKHTPIVNIRKTCTGMNVAQDTSPSAVVYKDLIYLFYNGLGNDGPWYTTNDGNNDTWTPCTPVLPAIGDGPSFAEGTSPSAVVYDDRIYLVWVGNGIPKGVPCARFDSHNWEKFHTPDLGIGIPRWPGIVIPRQKSTFVTFTLDDDPIPQGVTRATWGGLSEAIKSGTFFTIYSCSPILYHILEKKFKAHWTMPYRPEIADLVTFLADVGTETVDLPQLDHLMPGPYRPRGMSVETPSPGLVYWAMLYAATERPSRYNIVVTTDAAAQSVAIAFAVNIFK